MRTPRASPHPPEAFTASAVGLFVLVVYARTLYPDVPGGDAGELIAAVATGGVPHPPGYPLYALLGEAFLHVPFGTVAWRLNLMSAACDSAAAAVLYLAVARWARSTWAGLAATMLFAFAPAIWGYAVLAEVFALNNLFVALLLLLAVMWQETRDRRWVLWGALVFGLGLSNHQTIVFTGAPLSAWALWTGRRDLLRLRPLLWIVSLFALGLIPHLYLPIAAARDAAVTWGAADTRSGFWTHVLRREYGTFQLASTGVGSAVPASATLAAWARHLVDQIGRERERPTRGARCSHGGLVIVFAMS